MKDQNLFNQLVIAERYFKDTKYWNTVNSAVSMYKEGRVAECKEMLTGVPTAKQLLRVLTEKLKKKSVYHTLKKILEGKKLDKYTTLKGLWSLGTHVIIECEHGHTEYRMLLPYLLEKMEKLVYE